LEYAGADAVRRSGLHQKVGKEFKNASKAEATDRKLENSKSLGEAVQSHVREETMDPLRERSEIDRERGGSGKYHRARPGAALASTPRGQVSIVPSKGKKIKF